MTALSNRKWCRVAAVGIFYISVIAIILGSIFSGPPPIEVLRLDQALLDRIASKYGPDARQRFVGWQNLMEAGKTASEPDKLRQVNDFFNQNIQKYI